MGARERGIVVASPGRRFESPAVGALIAFISQTVWIWRQAYGS
jgi:hypothetical protein